MDPESPYSEALDIIADQHARGMPRDDMLVPTSLAIRCAAMCGHMPMLGIENSTIFGVRVGYPCPKCGRRKKNKGLHSCDGCGFRNKRG